VSVLHDGTGLKRRLDAERPSIVVLDVMMPEQRRHQCAARIARGRRRHPVIFLTARSDVIDRVIGLELGADDYLAKPFDPRELLARIRTVLRRRDAASPGAPEDRPPYRFGPYEGRFCRARVAAQRRTCAVAFRRICDTEDLRQERDGGADARAVEREACGARRGRTGIAVSMYPYGGCGVCWKPIRPIRATSRPFGARATFLCRMARPAPVERAIRRASTEA